MNRSELIDQVAETLGAGRSQATRAVETVFQAISSAVAKGERVAISGFGVFEKRDRPARTARNPATGESVKVKKTSVPAFRAGQGFKDQVSGAKKSAGGGRTATAKKSPAKATPAKRTAVKRTSAAKSSGTARKSATR